MTKSRHLRPRTHGNGPVSMGADFRPAFAGGDPGAFGWMFRLGSGLVATNDKLVDAA